MGKITDRIAAVTESQRVARDAAAEAARGTLEKNRQDAEKFMGFLRKVSPLMDEAINALQKGGHTAAPNATSPGPEYNEPHMAISVDGRARFVLIADVDEGVKACLHRESFPDETRRGRRTPEFVENAISDAMAAILTNQNMQPLPSGGGAPTKVGGV